ncbi:MAG: hypothetical protein ABL909_05380 [Sphingopyxis sp.]
MARFPWSALGLTPSATAQDVRRAYAQRLRAIDPDSDPQAFAKLRQARDRALGTIRARNAAEEDNADSAKDDLIDAQASLSIKLPPPSDDALIPSSHSADASVIPPVYSPHAAPRIDSGDGERGSGNVTANGDSLRQDMAAHQETLMAILLDGDPEMRLTDDEQARVSGALNLVFANPMMHAIDTAADMENWLAHVFAQSTPRSHPFAQRLADQFNWRQEAGTINQAPAVRWLTERALAFDFRDRVTQPSNKGYGAWIELTTPADDYSKRGRAKMVPELLSAIRRDHPVLEHELDWFRVSLWDRGGSSGSSGGSGFSWWQIAIGIFVALQILGALGRGVEPTTDQQQVAQVQRAEFDDPVRRRVAMDDALRAMGGEDLTITSVEIRRPAIIAAFNRRLDELKLILPNLEAAEPHLRAVVGNFARGGAAIADHRFLVEYRQSQSAILRRLSASNPQKCSFFIYDGSANLSSLLPYDLISSWQRLTAQLIMLDGGEERIPPPAREIVIPSATLEHAALLANMSVADLRSAFAGDGSPQNRCAATAAILNAATIEPQSPALLELLRAL